MFDLRRYATGLPIVAVLACGVAACGGDGGDETAAAKPPAASVLRLTVEPSPGEIKFDKKRLRAPAGTVVVELTNPHELGHNVRVATGEKCCGLPGSTDLGGTNTIGKGVDRAEIELAPGRYWFYCSIGGHWQRGQRGRLIVQ